MIVGVGERGINGVLVCDGQGGGVGGGGVRGGLGGLGGGVCGGLGV